MISSAAVNPSSGYEATPMLNVRWRPGIVFTPAAWTASTIRYASRWAAAPLASEAMTASSSPP